MTRGINQLTRDLIDTFGQVEPGIINRTAGQVEKMLLSRPRDEISDNMFGALVSIAVDIGIEAFRNSTLLQRINARDYAGALPEFAKWNTSPTGKPLRLRARRRQTEAALFCSFPRA